MLRTAVLATLALALTAPARAEEADKALDTYAGAVKAMNASEGYHLDSKIDVDMAGSSMEGGSVEGVIRNPDFGHFKVSLAGNALELFKSGDRVAMLNPQTGKWEKQAGNQTLDFFIRIFNLGTLLDGFKTSAEEVEFGKNDDIGKRECRTVEFVVPKAALTKLLEGTGQKSMGISPENATMRVKAWIDRKENLPRKIRIVIDVELKGLPGAPDGGDSEEWGDDGEGEEEGEKGPEGEKEPKKENAGDGEGEQEVPPMKITITVTASIKNYGRELDVEVPEAAQKVLDEQKKDEPTEGPKNGEKEDEK